jgi:adenylate kinase
MGIRAIVLLGAPGAGKGTMAEAIKAAVSVTHIATGDMLREEIKKASRLGKVAADYVQQGRLVPDDIIVSMVMERLAGGGAGQRYMFDGFPRTVPQAELLDSNFKEQQAEITVALLLEVSPEVCLERLTGRRVCRQCGANYHLQNIPPRREGICDRCGGELFRRQDDMPETIMKRLEVFRQQTAGLLDYYEHQGKLARVDAGGVREDTLAAALRILAERNF